MAEKLYIIDGHSQIYRAYWAPMNELTSPAGEPTKATYVFCNMLLRFIQDFQPAYLAMAMDGPAEKLRRRHVYADYKITRKPTPEDFRPQVRRIVQIARLMGIPILEAEGYEADDILATLARRWAGLGHEVVLISRDKDLDQLVGPHVVLYDPMKGQTLDAAAIEAEKGYPPAKAVEVQVLTGDDTDNIPGVPGIGPKTAARLITQYGGVEGVLAHADELSPKLRENLLAHAGQFALARELVTLCDDVPMNLDLEALRFQGLRGAALRPVFAELGFTRLLDQLDRLGAPAAQGEVVEAAATAGQTTAADFDYRLVDTAEGLEAVVAEIRAGGVKRLSVDTETTSPLPMWAELVGISLAWRPGQAVYMPVRGPLGATTLDLDFVRERLGPILGDADIEKIGQNIKYDLTVLANAGLPVAGRMFDTMVAAHVLDSTRITYKLDVLAGEYLHHRGIPIQDLIGKGKNQIRMDAVPTDVVATYASEDADVALRLSDVLRGLLEREGLMDLFWNLEMPLLPVLCEMERAGVRVDPQVLKRLEVEFSKKADELRGRIVAAAGCEFNVDSPRQLATVLFERLNLPAGKTTKTGQSTDSSVLEELAVLHELPALVLDYRRLTKLIGTYLTALAACIHPRTGRIHTCFHQAGTATGRLSSSDPNLQNIPVRTEEGRRIRVAFIAPPGCVLLSADYSQVELRVLAHLCQDPTLIAAFQADQDIHRIVAAEVFGVSVQDVTPEQRARAKTVNFGIIYGQTAYGLSVTLRIPKAEAASFIQRYKKRFPRIEEFLGACVQAARDNGYVETLFKRRRRIQEIDSSNSQRRALAERLAINSVVQGSAADLIKQAMINIAARIRRENRPSHMLLQIHDELLFELPAEAVEAEREMVVAEMSRAIALCVPLKVDAGFGANWMEAK